MIKALFLKKKCTKGKNCNYLHIFPNPYNEFPINERRHASSKRSSPKSKTFLTRQSSNRQSNDWSSDDEGNSKKRSWETIDASSVISKENDSEQRRDSHRSSHDRHQIRHQSKKKKDSRTHDHDREHDLERKRRKNHRDY